MNASLVLGSMGKFFAFCVLGIVVLVGMNILGGAVTAELGGINLPSLNMSEFREGLDIFNGFSISEVDNQLDKLGK